MELTPWMSDLIIEYGFVALMLVSFIAATILPFSSEAALSLGILAGIPAFSAIVACSIGNCAACSFNYGLGALVTSPQKIQKSKSGKKAYNWVKKYGWSSLFLSWLPIVGDPITIVSGIFRQEFPAAVFVFHVLSFFSFLWYPVFL